MNTDRHPVEANSIELSENALAVLKKRYLKKNEAGEAIEEPIDMFRRVAGAIAEAESSFVKDRRVAPKKTREIIEQKEQKFLNIMLSRKFMPNSPTLMNAGRDLGQLSACFVLPVEDSIDGIYDTLKHQAIVHKSGGGTGFGFSKLRPKGDLVSTTMGVSSGPVSFMSIYDASTEHIKQGGFRRGANMGILRVDHPDIEEFITCKKDNDQINNFNISVAITDDFIDAVKQDTDFDLTNPRDGEVVKTVRARELFRQIVEGAWLNGEPGVVFIDRINDDNPTPQFPIEATNPCSEAHLPAYDSCNLGSINLERFCGRGPERRAAAEDRAAETNGRLAAKGLQHRVVPSVGRKPGNGRPVPDVDWGGLADTVKTAVRFLDNVIEANRYPLPEIEEMSRGNRRIGLGVMGFADALIKLGIPYDSEEALHLAESIMEFIDLMAWEASRALAEERGVFDNWEDSRHAAGRKSGGKDDRVRNATVTTIAPTGTISMIAGCSGGIEPLFAVAFMRRQADMEMPDVNPEFVKLARERGFYSEELMTKVAEHGSVREIPEIPEDVRGTWVTSHDISSEWHVKMQAAFQKHTSMGISKTINLPNHATPKDVEDAYMQAFATGCKGIAVYRDGSRDAQVLATESTSAPEPAASMADMSPPEVNERLFKRAREFHDEVSEFLTSHGHDLEELLPNHDERAKALIEAAAGVEPTYTPAPPARTSTPVSLAEARNGRPGTLSGVTKKLSTGHGPMYVSMNDDEFGPRECFIVLGKPGGTAAAFSDALGRMVSLAEKHGASAHEIVGQLRGIQDGHPAGFGEKAVLSVPDGVAKAMAEHYLSAEEPTPDAPQLPIIGACPDCSGELVRQEGCVVCHSCGYSKCS